MAGVQFYPTKTTNVTYTLSVWVKGEASGGGPPPQLNLGSAPAHPSDGVAFTLYQPLWH